MFVFSCDCMDLNSLHFLRIFDKVRELLNYYEIAYFCGSVG